MSIKSEMETRFYIIFGEIQGLVGPQILDLVMIESSVLFVENFNIFIRSPSLIHFFLIELVNKRKFSISFGWVNWNH